MLQREELGAGLQVGEAPAKGQIGAVAFRPACDQGRLVGVHEILAQGNQIRAQRPRAIASKMSH